ncbi:high affinity cationic amino acid transporter 1-like isoform X2 [Coccinella septempunctata]|uniref:high affinity cationic amino acid transporter 1-like isoform X2 n=1 Tax=Coccinella septempunctata TaxID=41139 RepID=UPI001D06EE70|nr:high affinity cationic amino acid transporter 1-like isoform X2 [Coccinella septempunctata]
MSTLWKVLTRRKVLDTDEGSETPLARVLNTFDLTALGVGSTLGVGVYVLAGQVAKNTAGPAVIISFLIAAIASVFAGLCYAEFGARTPKAGSAYIYSYVCVGEFIAFVIGWNLILEYIIGSASVAKGLSSYVDNLCNGSLSSTFRQLAPIDVPYLSPYFDIFAFTVPIILSIALAFGMKESSLLNNIFTSCNIGVVLFVIVAGAMNAHWSNWFINPNDVKNVTNSTNLGHGGFFPFGIQGVIKGAATCFYGFVGFDCIATTGEEVKNPKKAIPIAIISSLLIIFLAYFGTSTVLTLMVPYYEQDPTAPIPFAFQSVHWYTAAYIVTGGAMFGLYASLFGAMFPLPRILYAMASDGLIFRFLGRINQRFKTPVIGTLLAGIFTGTMAAVFALDSLVNMMSIGTLLAYTIVAACVLLLRHIENHNREPINASEETALTDTTEESPSVIRQIFNFSKIDIPNKISQTIVTVDICLFCILCFILGLCALYLKHDIVNGDVIPLSAVTVILILMSLTMLSISSQPVSRTTLSFQVPCVPLIPALSIFCNIYLMVMLDIATWIRFVVWMILGIPIFYLTRRCLSKIDENITTDIPIQGHVNKGFYGDNLVYSNGCDANQESLVIIDEKMIPSLEIVENLNETDGQTPSPSRVIESLDFVIDSYVDDTTNAYVMSTSDAPSAFVLSNKLLKGDFRDTPNSALRNLLLNNLKDDINTENVDKISNENKQIDFDLIDKNNLSIQGQDDETHKSERDHTSSCSEISYVSASSSIDTGQNKTSDNNHSAGNTSPTHSQPPPPPPPPPLEGFSSFIPKKKESNPDNSNSLNESKTLERLKTNNRDPPMIINKNSLNSVKLRHVHRPSIERSHSEDDAKKAETATSTKEHYSKAILSKEKDKNLPTSTSGSFAPLVNLRHVRRPSLENRNEKDAISHSQNDSESFKPSRYVKSKSVSNLEKASSNENSGNNTLKRMGISKDAINSVKLKPVVRPNLSLYAEPKTDLPDSVKFGTHEFEEFKDKLNEKLKKPVKILREPSFVDPKTVPERSEIKVNRENVIDDNLDLAKARATMETEVGNKLNYLKNLKETEKSSRNEETESSIIN